MFLQDLQFTIRNFRTDNQHIALVIALLTVSWQSWKAAARNPVDALKQE